MTAEALSREDVDHMIAFAAERLEEDWSTAEAAGHGVHLDAAERGSHLAVEWTRLQEEGNVRLVYDVRFLNRYRPAAIVADIERKCRILESGDARAVRIVVQEWAGHPKFLPGWRLAPAPGLLLERLTAVRASCTGTGSG
jgi:hypothetical protein